MSSLSRKSYNQLSSANKYAFNKQNKNTKYHNMIKTGSIINWQTTHHAYNMGLTNLGKRCVEEGISWLT